MKFIKLRKLASKIKNYRWAVFAIFLTLLYVVCFVVSIVLNSYYTLMERLSNSAGLIGLLAFWGLALQKRIFQQFFWRLFFFIDAVLFVVCMVLVRRYWYSPTWWVTFVFIPWIVIGIPYYIGLFIYAFRSKQIWEREEYKPKPTYTDYTFYKRVRKKEWIKKYFIFLVSVALVVLGLTLVPLIIYNNRVIYPCGKCPPEYLERMLKYRRTTIPELKEFERLFPNYLCEFEHGQSNVIIDPNDKEDKFTHIDPNAPVIWQLFAGLYERYLLVMEVEIIYAQEDPETRKIISPGSHNEPVFSLWEVYYVDTPLVLFKRRFAWAGYSKELKTLTNDEWKKLVEAKGNFTALGIELKQDDPIPNFGLAFRNNR